MEILHERFFFVHFLAVDIVHEFVDILIVILGVLQSILQL